MKSQSDNTYPTNRRQSDYSDLPLFADICKNKHKGNAQSVAANEKASLSKPNTRSRILELLQSQDLTLHEIASQLGKEVHKVSGRLSELKALGLVVEIGRRNDAAILRRAA